MRPHTHLCTGACGRLWDCRGEHCSGRLRELCDDCQPSEPAAEREHLTDQRGAIPGCYRRPPAPGAE